MRLVGDVGGTNTRLALSKAGQILPNTTKSYSNVDWDSFYDVLATYLAASTYARPIEMVIAVAGPVQGGSAVLTNRNWNINSSQLDDLFGCPAVHLLNDLTALGYAVPLLKPSQLFCVNEVAHTQCEVAQSLVVGIGTGFNVSPVLQTSCFVICPAVEAGHVSMPLSIITLLQALGFKLDKYPTVEDLFSGRGFIDFCRHITGRSDLDGPNAILIHGTLDGADVTFAIDQYAILLGHLLKDLSLAYMPSAGIYFAGSVVRSVLKKSASQCIDILREPCKIHDISQTPVWVIQDDAAALIGCIGYSFQ